MSQSCSVLARSCLHPCEIRPAFGSAQVTGDAPSCDFLVQSVEDRSAHEAQAAELDTSVSASVPTARVRGFRFGRLTRLNLLLNLLLNPNSIPNRWTEVGTESRICFSSVTQTLVLDTTRGSIYLTRIMVILLFYKFHVEVILENPG